MTIRVLLAFLILIINFGSFANEVICFDPGTNMQGVRSYLDIIVLPQDNLKINNNCLGATLDPKRLELYQAYLSRKYKFTRPVETYRAQNGRRCDIKLIKRTRGVENDQNIKLGRRSKLKQNNSKVKKESTSSLLVDAGRPGKLRVGDDEISVICRVLGGQRVSLDLSLYGVSNSLSTVIDLNFGQEVEVGSVVEKLKEDNRKINIPVEASKGSVDKNVQTNFYIKVN